ncbi:hypothetical protein E4S40_15375 [Algoriphagus kandeliae]|uniref:Uncharacterized protein n=1 Tax=Algoriphagus kandeliae TaxID=2562278 RepID=A0A4Y9QPV3_9BACT|nr:DUF6090 family protein [Algoriphagus kandeliae]TFV93622.1 hypothetical protein E4S40_15375 [Algoriphagus kandeliae]
MISFFRKIRQKLLSQNRVTRYLTYAVGEIILVSIGILIALQVNNWNEERKTKVFEKEILSLISENLTRDSVLITQEYQKAVLANQITDSILNRVNQGVFDETLNIWMAKVIRFERFKSQTSGFEVLKSKGMDMLSDKTLQVDLINYYDEILFKVYQSLSDVEGSFNEDWIPLAKREFNDFDYDDRMEPRDLKTFMENQQHIVLFKMFQDNREGSINRMYAALQEISSLKSQIKAHLQ